MKPTNPTLALPAALVLLAGMALAQAARPTPPVRDPHTPGYVQATELPDGAVPSADADGNFIIGPTHIRRAGADRQPDASPKGTVFELHHELRRQQASIPASRAIRAPSARPIPATPPS